MNALDLFAGPGGWDAGASELGIDPLGIEWDDAACKTRAAAGLRTLQGDVAALNPRDFAPCDLLIASPPCQAWSMAGKRYGELDVANVYRLTAEIAMPKGRPELIDDWTWADPRSKLVTEPLRWALALEPDLIAWEQVPPVLDYWHHCASILRERGYGTWAGVLSSERYSVPQTRKRAILMAAKDRAVHPPAPTHQAYVPGEPAQAQHTLEGELLPWISMAEALGWAGQRAYDRRQQTNGVPVRLIPMDEPAPTIASQGLATGRDVIRFRAARVERQTSRPGHSEQGGPDAIRVSIAEASVLQGFAPDHPWQGSRTKQFEQVGNAVPPPLARAILEALTSWKRRAGGDSS